MLVVAHEGGRSTTAAQKALAWGADVVEVDVVAFHGRLYCSHNPLPLIGAPRAPSLSRLWPVDARAPIVELDLKESSPPFRHVLVAFLKAHRGAGPPQIFASSRDLATLRVLKTDAPNVYRFYSIGDAPHLHAFMADPAEAAVVDGVSVDYRLVNPGTITWMHRHRLLVFVWTVDDPRQAQLLIREGVDGITTDQPGIVKAIAHTETGERPILHRI